MKDKFFKFDKYTDQFQIGITFARHYHRKDNKHSHIWIDLGYWYIELTF
jgi:hypothetical protein